MERYVSEDKIPLDRCLEDVERSDIYIGIFGWKYGFIPSGDNEKKLSITELEFRHAQKLGIPCLTFLIAETVPVIPENMDAFTGNGESGELIKNFRENINDTKIRSLFSSPEDLSVKVITALQTELTKEREVTVVKAEEFAKMLTSQMTSSEGVNITKIINNLIGLNKNIPILEIDLKDGQYWWCNRLFLLSALIVDYTAVGCFAFFGSNGFVGLATPLSLLRTMTFAYPKIAKAYYKTLQNDDPDKTEVTKITLRVEALRDYLQTKEGERGSNIKVNEQMLLKWLGTQFNSEIIEIGNSQIDSEHAHKILSRKFKYIPIISKDRKLSIIDKDELANNIASGILNLV